MNKKRALCVGTNYAGTSNELSGCVNDAVAWQKILGTRGYEVTMLLESAASKANITESLRAMTRLTGYRDTFVFTYSGHGSWVPDASGDEADGRDEVLVPHDFQRAGMLSDDELFEIWGGKRYGARLVSLIDACHSGTVARLFGGTAVGQVRFLPPGEFLSGQDLSTAYRVQAKTVTSKPRQTALLISGCSDTEYSYDETSQYPPMGAFSRRAIELFKDGDTYRSWHARIRTVLPSDELPQAPQLGATWLQGRWKAL